MTEKKSFTRSEFMLRVTIAIWVLAIPSLLWVVPQYKVWQQRLAGEAALARAENEKLILLQTAIAEREAAKERAAAIATVGEASQRYPEYRKQEYMGALADALRECDIDQLVYIPTEAALPILGARDGR